MHYAHSREGRPRTEWEPLRNHLENVAQRAGEFAAAFGVNEWGRLAGLWHDLGKYSADFQSYLIASSEPAGSVNGNAVSRVDHSTRGAQHATQHAGQAMGHVLAYCIAGHHGGLPDAIDPNGGVSGLIDRLKKCVPDAPDVPPSLLKLPVPPSPVIARDTNDAHQIAFRLSVFTRMLFSALVDADYLATEAFVQPDRAAGRDRAAAISMHDLRERLDQYLAELNENARRLGNARSPVHHARQAVLRACHEKAALPPGLFSLTVPTGGGKTLSSLAFGLTHAIHHNLRRIIYAIPFTSIIEQNAQVFREALELDSAPVVLEHHSAFERPDSEFVTTNEPQTPWSEFASENWDAPVVVTTNVQFFESLFASRPSRCRKLHNVAGSVVVLDEVQVLPPELLEPTLAVLRELCRFYRCSVVLCTATQPAFGLRDDFTIGFRRGEGLREIVDDPARLHAALRRTEIVNIGKQSDDELVAAIAEHEQVLCVVNTKRTARNLFERLTNDAATATFYLSTNLCAAHRADKLSNIRSRLDAGQPCRVISTQLIEAGVDIDFPVVYRAVAGIDSIHQAAGRCNREGRRAIGKVFVFENGDRPPASLAAAVQAGRETATTVDDLQALTAVERYFENLFWRHRDDLDKHQVLRAFRFDSNGSPHFQFREAADRYRLIRDKTFPVIVPYTHRGHALIEELRNRHFPPNRDLARKLQRYTVSIREHELRKLDAAGALEICHEHYAVLTAPSAYHSELGLITDNALPSINELII